MKPWTRILLETNSGGGTGVVINRPRALRARDKGDRTGYCMCVCVCVCMHITHTSHTHTHHTQY